MRVHGEDMLDETLKFTATHLELMPSSCHTSKSCLKSAYLKILAKGRGKTLLFYLPRNCFTWDINCIDQLRDYMKLCYKAVLDVFEEIKKEMCKEGKLCVHYAKVAA
ncbi:putative terpene synthase 2 [Quercus suber]|uniref:Terpene synthase 2 n=1 Tax=Quercus suber TaxID=58331 RepID=A0AAW0LNX3_QUESU